MRNLFPRIKGTKFLALREELLEITGDPCEAALLALFEYWTVCRMETQEESLWVPVARAALAEAMFGLYSERAIWDRLKSLTDKKFLDVKGAEGVGGKRSYLLMIDAVCEAITDSAYGQNCRRAAGRIADEPLAELPPIKEVDCSVDNRIDDIPPTPQSEQATAPKELFGKNTKKSILGACKAAGLDWKPLGSLRLFAGVEAKVGLFGTEGINAWRQGVWDSIMAAVAEGGVVDVERLVTKACWDILNPRGKQVANFATQPSTHRRDRAPSESRPQPKQFPHYKNAQERSDEMWAKISDEMYAEEEAENG